MEDWGKYYFSETLVKNNANRNNQIKSSEILEIGEYPVIDQSQKYIAGYSDDVTKVYYPDQPVIIFGDHTRCFKYVDFPFIIGADGTKVLTPNIKLFEPKFYYFFLLSLYIENRGYNRHFTLLKEKIIECPPIYEQLKIACILSTIQSAIEKQEELIRVTTELKKALMQKLFTEGLRGEKQKITDIGPVSESWEVVELNNICENIKLNYSPNPNGNKKYIGLEHIESGIPFLSNHGYEMEVKSGKYYFKAGQILYGKLRPYLDKVVLTEFEGICSTDIIVLNGRNNIQNDFLIYFLHYDKFIEYAIATTTGVQHPRTSWNSLKKIKLGLPDKSERNEISSNLRTLDLKIKITKQKRKKLEELFKNLLNQLMTGQIRVNEIEVGELNYDLND